MKLGALFSSGKDSTYAIYLMQKQNYKISCLITIKSDNLDSYMFHTPSVDIANLQAKAMDIPLIKYSTKGEKETELQDLKKAIKEAKERYNIEGIVTGALFSKYQKKRIEKICNELSLKVFSPLWHKDQKEYMYELIDNRFKFIITKIAAEGLDESWLGKEISKSDIDRLVELDKKVGINIAFEGGEAETLMVDGPLFKSRITIKKAKKDMENEFTGIYDIMEVELE